MMCNLLIEIFNRAYRWTIFEMFNINNFGHGKPSATDTLDTASKSTIQKTGEATGNLADNKLQI